MTRPDQLILLERVIAEIGQAQLARELGCSDSALSQIRGGTYKGSPDNILRKVEDKYSTDIIQCPLQGAITVQKCAEHRNRPFAATNPQRVALYRQCRLCGGKP